MTRFLLEKEFETCQFQYITFFVLELEFLHFLRLFSSPMLPNSSAGPSLRRLLRLLRSLGLPSPFHVLCHVVPEALEPVSGRAHVGVAGVGLLVEGEPVLALAIDLVAL